MLPQLPFDVILHIFRSITPSRLDDDGPRALVCCLQANSLFHEACSDPGVWRSHYQCRYTLSEPRLEHERKSSVGNNWRALYAERRRIDKTGMAYLEDMVLSRALRCNRATALSTMALDVWDALDIARHLPIPVPFRITASEPGGEVQVHALTRRYWANRMADIIIKCSALEEWNSVIEEDGISSPEKIQSGASFERVVSAFSCFFGTPISETTSQLDQLASQCRIFLLAEGSKLDPVDETYDIRQICKGICRFMYQKGFGVCERHRRHMLTHFPHSYLTTNRKTLQISLAHVFIAICSRIGISASPVNFPGTVIVHVDIPGTGGQGFIANPSIMDPDEPIMETSDLLVMASDLSMPVESLSEHLVPCKASALLKRHSHNILFAFQEDGALDLDHWLPALLAAVSTQFLLGAELPFLAMLISSLVELTPVDCSTFILNKLAKMVPPERSRLLERMCTPTLSKEVAAASAQRIRQENVNATVRYFVGMLFQHALYGYLGCIVGWDFTCAASEDWIRHVQVDGLPRGRRQPFYHVIADDASSRYVAEENIVVINPSIEIVQKLYSTVAELPTYFEDVELNETGGTWSRGRFLLSPESRLGYPQDDGVGARWQKDGQLPY